MGRDKSAKYRDPRGHSIRIYDEIYDSFAWGALTPHQKLAYLALLRELRATNNGDLALTEKRAKTTCGIKHSQTLADCLRALCAVGLIALTRKCGCTRGGQKLSNLYRVTDVACFENPAKHIDACLETNEWKLVQSVEHAKKLIADDKARWKSQARAKSVAKSEKTKSLPHAVSHTTSPDEVVKQKTTSPDEVWSTRPPHQMRYGKNTANPATRRVSSEFGHTPEKQGHTSPNEPLYILPSMGGNGDASVQDRETSNALEKTGAAHEQQPAAASPPPMGELILDALRDGPKTIAELQALGLTSVGSQIYRLKTAGRIRHDIQAEYFTIKGEHGRRARYTLHEDPRPHEPETTRRTEAKEATTL